MKNSPLHKLMIVIGLLVVASTAHAQDDLRDRVMTAIEMTDLRIEQAETLVTDSGNEPAASELSIAIDLQGRAKAEFGRGQLRFALDLTLRAMERANRVIALIRGLPDPERVKEQLERTMELLDRARDQIEECDQQRARAMLNIAGEMQKRAIRSAEEGRYLAALQLTTSARERALNALRLCRMEDNVAESSERALRRTDEIIVRAQDQLARAEEDGSLNERAKQALERAESLQERAQSEFHGEHFKASLRLTQSARAFAHRAIRLVNARR